MKKTRLFYTRREYKKIQQQLVEAQATIKKLKQGTIPEAVKPKVEEVFKDDEGRIYYRFKEPTEMPWRWASVTRVWLEWQQMNLTPELFDAFMEKATEAANNGDIVKAFQLLGNMKDRRNLLPSAEVTWRLAALLYLREDERPEDEPAEALIQEKIAYWKSKPAVRDFFLSMCLRELFDFGTKSPEHILASFRKDQKTLERLTPDPPPQK